MPLTHPDAVRLIAAVQREYEAIFGSPDESPMDAAEFEPPFGEFYVGYLGDTPAMTVGWRLRPDVEAFGYPASAEIKRMYVLPELRGHGLARRLVAAVEDKIRAAGVHVVVLETSTRQPAAVRTYEAAGYTTIQPFGYYAGERIARYFGRVL